jgi:hypothetical protein
MATADPDDSVGCAWIKHFMAAEGSESLEHIKNQLYFLRIGHSLIRLDKSYSSI